ncbi:dihydrofolate reductase family protein [Neisseriaceae bacterium CLB008]
MAIKGYIAVSADGYIATADGNVDFLNDFQHIDCGYEAFIAGIQTVVMGRKTYEAILGFGVDWPYPEQRCLIVSTQADLPLAAENVSVWGQGLPALIEALRQEAYGDTWVVGGAQLQAAFIEHDYLDTLDVYELPIFLGGGIPLFPQSEKMHLRAVKIEAEMIDATIVHKTLHFK